MGFLYSILSLFVFSCFCLPGFLSASTGAYVNTGRDIQHIVSNMTLAEKVGQLFIIGLPDQKITPRTARLLRRIKPGGVIVFSWNIENMIQLARFTQALQDFRHNRIPLMIATDQEGGKVVRLYKGATVFPGNMCIGATRSKSLSFWAGKLTGLELKSVGINMNLAPVIDVNSQTLNNVIGVRSFGGTPRLVSELGRWYIKGLHSGRVMATAKHFPGHGSTKTDSHYGLPEIKKSASELNSVDFIPFKRAIDENVDAIMTAHVLVPSLDSGNEPATVSKKMITGILRKKLGYRGIVMTDDMEMKGILSRYPLEKAVKKAILAGTDMVMLIWKRKNKLSAYRAVLRAVKKGEIPVSRINESVKRILAMKKKWGLLNRSDVPDPNLALSLAGNDFSRKVASNIALRGITVLKNTQNRLPISRNRRVVFVTPLKEFSRLGKRYFKHTREFKIPLYPSLRTDKVLEKRLSGFLKSGDIVLWGMLNRHHAKLLKKVSTRFAILDSSVTFVGVSFDVPFLLSETKSIHAYVCTFSYNKYAILSLFKVLTGKRTASGVLPVARKNEKENFSLESPGSLVYNSKLQ